MGRAGVYLGVGGEEGRHSTGNSTHELDRKQGSHCSDVFQLRFLDWQSISLCLSLTPLPRVTVPIQRKDSGDVKDSSSLTTPTPSRKGGPGALNQWQSLGNQVIFYIMKFQGFSYCAYFLLMTVIKSHC